MNYLSKNAPQYRGIYYRIRPNMIGALLAYVQVPLYHPLYKIHYSEIYDDAEITNGGFTFSGFQPAVDSKGETWWLGWDYAHAHDFDKIHTYAEVEEDVRKVIDWLLDHGDKS